MFKILALLKLVVLGPTTSDELQWDSANLDDTSTHQSSACYRIDPAPGYATHRTQLSGGVADCRFGW